ncbi:SpaA isopeptide-forming pilin-related protein [Streptococcus pneumoniae]|nr:SpaA isopeptide-forming pilin-related protein [Streptococcus pneumoniae]
MKKVRKIFQKAVAGLCCISQLTAFSSIVALAETPETSPAIGKVVIKETGEGGALLGDAVFELKNNTDGTTVSQRTEAQTGEAIFSNIKPGTYTLTEAQPPVGYKPSTKQWTVEVEKNGRTTVQGEQVENREEALSDQYPQTGTYPDVQTPYQIIKVDGSEKNGQHKALNPNPYERVIPEGTLSKRIYQVNNLDDNQYGIELTVSGKTTVETKEASTPLDVVILLDNSNSMSNIRHNHAHRAEKAGEATRALVDKITSNPDNRVALVTYGSTIFDGSEATVEKGVADANGKILNDSALWTFDRTTFTAKTYNYSFLNLTSDPTDIQTIKDRIPSDAEELNKDKLMYQFGATFTQKALMTADDILTKQARPNSKKVIFHITDGVPTMSYPINFKYTGTTQSYRTQLNNFKAKTPNSSGILLEDFVTWSADGEHKIVRGDGESYQMFTKKPVTDQYGVHQILSITSMEQRAKLVSAGYRFYGTDLYLYWHDSILAYPFNSSTDWITNHGDPTTWYYNGNMAQDGYDVFTVGVGVNGDPGTDEATATRFMQSISSSPDNYTNVADPSQILQELNRYFYTIVNEKKSIENGTITDPMGELIDFQLGADGRFDPADYTLTANDGSSLVNNVPTGGPQNDGGLLKNAKVFYDTTEKRIRVTGLYLGTGEKVTLTYNVRLNDQFVSNKFYDTNGRTTLHPKEVEKNTVRDFPIPKIRDVRKYPEITIPKEKKLGEIEFIKINKNDKKPLRDAVFSLQKQHPDYPDIYGAIDQNGTYQNVRTGEDGKLTFKNLSDGKYRLFENSEPAGYKPVQNKPIVAFQIVNGEVRDVTSIVPQDIPAGYEFTNDKHYITNEPIPPKREYPRTGGIGMLPFYLIGCMMMGGVLLYTRKHP